jgi:hypothetical protein
MSFAFSFGRLLGVRSVILLLPLLHKFHCIYYV